MPEITQGVAPPIVTPFDETDSVDYDEFAAHIDRLEAAGVDGIVSCGTTGERATLRPDEHRDVIEFAVEQTNPETNVIAGTGSSSTWETIELSAHAADVGADGLLVIAPYYSAPSDDHVVRHYRSVADAVDIPLIVYNYPGGAGYTLSADVVVELSDHPNIAGTKDSTGDMGQINDLCDRTADEDFDVMSGWDALAFPAISVGATGVIGIIGNIFPEDVCALVDAARNDDTETARRIHRRIVPLGKALVQANAPITVKKSLDLLDLGSPHVRPPQYPPSDDQVEALREALDRYERMRE
jgi:4-hydroxy-tetrahydrodipicolinate synthase